MRPRQGDPPPPGATPAESTRRYPDRVGSRRPLTALSLHLPLMLILPLSEGPFQKSPWPWGPGTSTRRGLLHHADTEPSGRISPIPSTRGPASQPVVRITCPSSSWNRQSPSRPRIQDPVMRKPESKAAHRADRCHPGRRHGCMRRGAVRSERSVQWSGAPMWRRVAPAAKARAKPTTGGRRASRTTSSSYSI